MPDLSAAAKPFELSRKVIVNKNQVKLTAAEILADETKLSKRAVKTGKL